MADCHAIALGVKKVDIEVMLRNKGKVCISHGEKSLHRGSFSVKRKLPKIFRGFPPTGEIREKLLQSSEKDEKSFEKMYLLNLKDLKITPSRTY